jgi:hypothetical protein
MRYKPGFSPVLLLALAFQPVVLTRIHADNKITDIMNRAAVPQEKRHALFAAAENNQCGAQAKNLAQPCGDVRTVVRDYSLFYKSQP